jgi:hypothetical protein
MQPPRVPGHRHPDPNDAQAGHWSWLRTPGRHRDSHPGGKRPRHRPPVAQAIALQPDMIAPLDTRSHAAWRTLFAGLSYGLEAAMR